jgi:hypothetical protein
MATGVRRQWPRRVSPARGRGSGAPVTKLPMSWGHPGLRPPLLTRSMRAVDTDRQFSDSKPQP